ncbi:MAG: hypothetical protein ACPGGJ_00425 [Coraliomargarita sp.]
MRRVFRLGRIMRSFESFKASRMKMDPSARKMSDYQWQQAYAAYKRVRGHRTEESEEANDSTTASKPRVESAMLLAVRQSTAYQVERKWVDRIFAVSLAVILLSFFLGLGSGFTATRLIEDAAGNMRSVNAVQWGLLLASVFHLVFELGIAVLLRHLAHVCIDIPDIALFQARQEEPLED